MIQDHIKNIILEKAISLEKFELNDLAWKKVDAINLLNSLMRENIGLYGGDVCILEANQLKFTYDNWYAEPKNDEPKNAFFLRSKKQSLDYINNYPIGKDKEEKIIFIMVFTEIVCFPETENN